MKRLFALVLVMFLSLEARGQELSTLGIVCLPIDITERVLRDGGFNVVWQGVGKDTNQDKKIINELWENDRSYVLSMVVHVDDVRCIIAEGPLLNRKI